MSALSISCLRVLCCSPALGDEAICEAEISRAARETDVPVPVLYAVGMTETGQRGSLHAYALNIHGRPSFNATLSEALDVFRAAKSRGETLVDIGCMQVNHHYHRRGFQSDVDMFDPAKNVDYAARLLKKLRETEGSWTGAVARYHAGPGNPPAQRAYVCAVIRNMIASGFGAWTSQAEAFCRR